MNKSIVPPTCAFLPSAVPFAIAFAWPIKGGLNLDPLPHRSRRLLLTGLIVAAILNWYFGLSENSLTSVLHQALMENISNHTTISPDWLTD